MGEMYSRQARIGYYLLSHIKLPTVLSIEGRDGYWGRCTADRPV